MKTNEYVNAFCTGCGLCNSVCNSSFKEDKKGFPYVNLSKDDDTAIHEQVCPVFYYSGQCEHDVWGVVDSALVMYSSDEDIRYKAASGGALTEICVQLLEEKSVDAILHTTYSPDDSTKTINCVSLTSQEVKSRCGSRYSISTPLKDLFTNIDLNKKYAFVGKPCDVMALRSYMKTDEKVRKAFVYLLSFFCAGEPSQDAQKALLAKMNCTMEDCENILYRGNGWPGYTTVTKKDGTVNKLEYKVAWGQYLGRDIRDICRLCMDGTGDAADIVCADFWYLDENGKPDFSEHEGRNIVISRNKKGTELVQRAVSAGRLVCESDFTGQMDEFYKYQPHQYTRKSTMGSVIAAMKLFGKKTPQYSRSYIKKYSVHADAKTKWKYFKGTVKRCLKGRI